MLSQVAPKNEGEVENEQRDSKIIGHWRPSCGRKELICCAEQEGGAQQNPFQQIEGFWRPGGMKCQTRKRNRDQWQSKIRPDHDEAVAAAWAAPGVTRVKDDILVAY